MENSSYIGLKKIRSDSHLEIFLLGLRAETGVGSRV